MYEVLKENLRTHPQAGKKLLWWLIEDVFDIHTGVADKYLLLNHLKETDHESFFDLQDDATNFLWNIGYRSERLKQLIDEYPRSEKFAVRRWEETWEMKTGRKLSENQ